MDEIIVRICRTIACSARLRMLSSLARNHELTPTGLAETLGLSLPLVSAHLARLSSAGLVQRRRSGVWCYCKARSPYSEHALSGKITSWLRETLADSKKALKDCKSDQLGNRGHTDTDARLLDLIFEAATAFTNHRRLQLLRRLAGGEDVAGETLRKELHMSEAAVSRHTAKLIRRGYVQATASAPDQRLTYRLASDFKTPVHRRFFDIVQSAWPKEALQS